jgi:tRNA-splicing ligase RtcB
MADLAFGELNTWLANRSTGLPSILQNAYVATLPGITSPPLWHAGHAFRVWLLDINCGVRCLTTGLTRDQVQPHVRRLVEELYRLIQVGVGGKRTNFAKASDIPLIVQQGAGWAVSQGYGVPTDLENCEEHGSVSYCDPSHTR